EPRVEIPRVIHETIASAGRLAGPAHADEIGRQAPTQARQVRNHVAPEVRRRRIAVEEDDRRADPDLYVRHEAVEDRDTPPLVEVRRRDRVRHGADIISTPGGGCRRARWAGPRKQWLAGSSGPAAQSIPTGGRACFPPPPPPPQWPPPPGGP